MILSIVLFVLDDAEDKDCDDDYGGGAMTLVVTMSLTIISTQ